MSKVLNELIESQSGFKIIPIIIFSDKFNLEKILKTFRIANNLFEVAFIHFLQNPKNTQIKCDF